VGVGVAVAQDVDGPAHGASLSRAGGQMTSQIPTTVNRMPMPTCGASRSPRNSIANGAANTGAVEESVAALAGPASWTPNSHIAPEKADIAPVSARMTSERRPTWNGLARLRLPSERPTSTRHAIGRRTAL